MPVTHRLILPTPFPVGPVNVYVLRPDQSGHGRLTLVDTGPGYAPARAALAAGLETLGLAPRDIELILLTHPHVDHCGLAAEIVAQSGARVAAHAEAVPHLEGRLRRNHPDRRAAMARVLVRSGASEELLTSLWKIWGQNETLGAAVTVDQALVDGELIEGGGVAWKGLSTPGHTGGSMCFLDEAGRRLISGDHLLPRITSNAILDLREAEPGGPALAREKSLEMYIEALRRVETLDVAEVLPGHGAPFTGHGALIARRMRHYERRKSAVAAILGRLGPSTALRVSESLFPEQRAPIGRFLALSEALGHLDLLETDGRVRRIETETQDIYALA